MTRSRRGTDFRRIHAAHPTATIASAQFFTPRGKDPRAASKIDIRIDRAEKGNFGDHKFERDGVWELRVDYGPGYRVYYAIEGDKMTLLFIGGDKSSQSKDLDKAVQYWRDYQKR
ncbi:addiction module killer protein [Pectobacterium brasiliense]|nr:addiction module killer protein [Pectobacterium brasiliense]